MNSLIESSDKVITPDMVFENLEHRLLNAEELAHRLGCTEKHIRNLVFRREIPFIKVGRLVRFNVVEVRKWLQKRSYP